MKTWYLGIHMPSWLANERLADVPVFISRRTFMDRRTGRYRKTFPRAVGRYAVDSGGFTELKDFGKWTISADEYIEFLERLQEETGPYDFAAPRDRMCEPAVITGGTFAGLHFVGTGLTLEQHLELTAEDGVDMRQRAPHLRTMLVLQGWRKKDYHRCWDLYEQAGIDLTKEPVVGIGSVCRRQHMDEAADILDSLWDRGLRNMHGFGFKITGLRTCWEQLATADSMSWSKDGRHTPGCQHPPYARGKEPKNEANCLRFALEWRNRNIAPPTRPRERQLTFDFATPLDLAA
ncbi:hypothetical protein MED01_004255 [Micromonospora sp. MED01]|uniref:deazapurine DNA modification protein DpdA family protein n=1 Tax=Micromonospora alfalfae TaxID=2911212 RepID=UPI001EE841AF|nr:hypothetical protein [Micromonospora alfalfae]MCG5460829.1 hypothetical protein [Micromonospora alfalfae]